MAAVRVIAPRPVVVGRDHRGMLHLVRPELEPRAALCGARVRAYVVPAPRRVGCEECVGRLRLDETGTFVCEGR